MHTDHALRDQTDEEGHEVTKMLRVHRALLLNWFRAKGSNALGCVGRFNSKDKVVTRRPYSVRAYDGLKRALYQAVGDLPTPKATHRLCGGTEKTKKRAAL